MTYGVMPTRDEFDDAFDKKCGAGGTYKISNDRGGRDGDWDNRLLWHLLHEQMVAYNEEENEEAGDFVSAVLSTLGFEWI